MPIGKRHGVSETRVSRDSSPVATIDNSEEGDFAKNVESFRVTQRVITHLPVCKMESGQLLNRVLRLEEYPRKRGIEDLLFIRNKRVNLTIVDRFSKKRRGIVSDRKLDDWLLSREVKGS